MFHYQMTDIYITLHRNSDFVLVLLACVHGDRNIEIAGLTLSNLPPLLSVEGRNAVDKEDGIRRQKFNS